jgi:hypothetical protein
LFQIKTPTHIHSLNPFFVPNKSSKHTHILQTPFLLLITSPTTKKIKIERQKRGRMSMRKTRKNNEEKVRKNVKDKDKKK